jgi:hypothetical protein
MSININNIKSINHYQIGLDNDEKMARLCLAGTCGHGTEDRCSRRIATDGWHESLEENRLMTVREYMMMAPSEAEEFIKRWDGGGANELRAKVAELRASDPLGILTMFAFLVGDPADEKLREEFYAFLDEDDVGPPVTESNMYWEMEKSMVAFADIKRASAAWDRRMTAHAGPNCDQCGNARTGIGGRVCEQCDLSSSTHNHVICHCCVDDREDYDYDDGSQPPRDIHPAWHKNLSNVVRRTHDDGFDEHEDEEERQMEAEEQHCNRCGRTLTRCWCDRSAAYLTGEQAEEREAENELNRAVFEHNSIPTSDPHIRISHLSPVVPDNWREIVNR